MQYADGRDWRTQVKEELKDRNITFFDPYFKPFINDIPEDNNAREELLKWMEQKQYDLVQQRMWAVRSYDLRLCDISDFFIANIIPSIASWGSSEEIATICRQKKPIFIALNGEPKSKVPLWMMGMFPHKYFYSSVDEIIEKIKAIDDGIVEMNSDRWKLLKMELR